MDGREITVFDLVNKFGKAPTYVIIYRFVRAHRGIGENIKVVKTHTYLLVWKV